MRKSVRRSTQNESRKGFGNSTVPLQLPGPNGQFIELTYNEIVNILRIFWNKRSQWYTLKMLAITIDSAINKLFIVRRVGPATHPENDRWNSERLTQIGALTLQQITTITSDLLVFNEKHICDDDDEEQPSEDMQTVRLFDNITWSWHRAPMQIDYIDLNKILQKASVNNFNYFINAMTEFMSGISFSRLPCLKGALTPQLSQVFTNCALKLTQLRMHVYEQHDSLLECDIKSKIEARTKKMLGKRHVVEVETVSRRILPTE